MENIHHDNLIGLSEYRILSWNHKRIKQMAEKELRYATQDYERFCIFYEKKWNKKKYKKQHDYLLRQKTMWADYLEHQNKIYEKHFKARKD